MGRGKFVQEYCKYAHSGEMRRENATLDQARTEANQTYQQALQSQQHAILALQQQLQMVQAPVAQTQLLPIAPAPPLVAERKIK